MNVKQALSEGRRWYEPLTHKMSTLWIERLLVTALTPLLLVGGQMNGQAEKDPHRPACTSPRCRTIRSYVKTHYCGAPEGNGPDDGCAIVRPKEIGAGVKVTADRHCEWVDAVSKCEQHGQPSSEARSILVGELRRLGLPAEASGQIYFTVWESSAAGWSLATAKYNHSTGPDWTLCHVVVIIDQSSHVHVLREVPFQKTDADVPTVATWSLIDLADVDGDGHVEVVLEGDAYEDHWLEVDSVQQDGSTRTIFSGLGYYL